MLEIEYIKSWPLPGCRTLQGIFVLLFIFILINVDFYYLKNSENNYENVDYIT